MMGIASTLRRLIGSPTGTRAYLVRGLSGSLLIQAAGLLLMFLSGTMFARLMGSENYGYYAYAYSIIEILRIPFAYGLHNFLTKQVSIYFTSQKFGELKELINKSMCLALFISVVLIGLSASLPAIITHGIWSAPVFKNTLYIGCALVPILTLSSIRTGVLAGLRRGVICLLPENIVRPIISMCSMAVLWIAIQRNVAPQAAMAIQAGAVLIAFAVGFVLLSRALPDAVSEDQPDFDTKRLASAIMPFVLSGAAFAAWSQLGTLIVGWYRAPEEVGVFRAIVIAAQLTLIPTIALRVIAGPIIAKLHHSGDEKGLRMLLWTSSAIAFLVAFGGFLFSLLVGKIALSVVFGPEYVHGAVALMVITGGNALYTMFWSSSIALDYSGHQQYTAYAYVGAASGTLLLGSILVPHNGIIGAGVATGVSWVTAHLVLELIARRKLGFWTNIFVLPPRAKGRFL